MKCFSVGRLWGAVGVASLALALEGCGSDRPIEPNSEAEFLVTRPTAPSNTSAVAVAYSSIKVSWKDNSSNESGFKVHRSTSGPNGTFSLRASTAANISTYSDAGLTPLKSYCYKVRGFRTQNGETGYSAFSSVACATTPAAPPTAPSGAVAKPVSSTAVSVSWSDHSSNEDEFRIQRSTDAAGATWTLAGTVSPNITTFRDNGRTSEQQVCYRVRAFNSAGGNSLPSNVDCTTPPATPTGLTAVGAAAGGINLTWADNTSVENGYQVQRSTDGTTFNAIATVAASATSYGDAEAANGTTYWYRVRAKSDGGFSSFSAVVRATAGSPSPIPAAPSGTVAKPWSINNIEISWADNSTNEEGFRVERSIDGGSSWTVARTVTQINIRSVQDYGLTIEQQVCYRVIAFNSQGNSPPSNTDCTAPPAVPTNLRASIVDQQTISLTWTDNSAIEDGYALERWRHDGIVRIRIDLPPNSTSYRDEGLSSGFTYSYIVMAKKDGGVSHYSNLVDVVLASTPPAAPSRTYTRPSNSSTIYVRWFDNSATEDAFRVERSTDGGRSWAEAGLAPAVPSPSISVDWFDGGRLSDQPVCHRVIAVNRYGDSPPSEMDCTTPPAGPTALTASLRPDGTVEFTWADNSAVEEGYLLVPLTDDLSYFPGEVYLPANSTSHIAGGNDELLRCRVDIVPTCRIFVVALKDDGSSDWSNGVAAP